MSTHTDKEKDDIKPLKDNSDVVVKTDQSGTPVSIGLKIHIDPRVGPLVEEALNILREFNEDDAVTKEGLSRMAAAFKKFEMILRQLDPFECAYYMSTHEECSRELDRVSSMLLSVLGQLKSTAPVKQ